MQVKILPSAIQGTVQAPPGKSFMQRACAMALLAKGKTTIQHPSLSNDDLAALEIIKTLGATVSAISNESITIESNGIIPNEDAINCGESGLSTRMFTPIAALCKNTFTITGHGSLLQRPMHFFDNVFPALQVKYSSKNGKLPLQVQGPLVPANITIDGSASSQYLTGLLIAYGASVTTPVSIMVNKLVSKPYIDITLQVMESFGVTVQNNDYKHFYFDKTNQQYSPCEYTIEGDWSSAAFLLVAGAIAGKVNVTGLNVHSVQADKAIVEVLQQCKANISINANQVSVGNNHLKAFHFDATDCPDLFPPLAALALYCHGTTSIKGVSRLAHKESDRAIALQQEFKKMGADLIIENDEMIIHGPQQLKGAEVDSHNDHRIAMACAVAGLKADGITSILRADAVNKSYKAVYNHLKLLGATVLIS